MNITQGNILYESYLNATKSSKWKTTNKRYRESALENIADLQDSLLDGTYHTDTTNEFIINERGKDRLIQGNSIKDRIVRHAICDYELVPNIEPYLVYDNAASRIGKGVDFARNRVKKHLYSYYHKNKTNKGYALVIDFSKYYDNISHNKAEEILREYTDNKWILHDIIDSMQNEVPMEFNENDKFDSINNFKCKLENKKIMHKGVNIGDQTSQIIGIYYPYKIDNYIRNVFGIGLSVRYMDDTIIIDSDKEKLEQLLSDIRKICDDLGIFINEKKTRIYRLDKGFNYLQRKYILESDGNIKCRMLGKQYRRFTKRIRKLSKHENITKEYLCNILSSWYGSYKKDVTKKQCRKFNAFREEILEL